ncbi:MAG: hypothetical protein ABIR54_03755 [Burkholderiaceae bacterium]
MMALDAARRFLQTYAAGDEVEQGWLFGKALKQASLDYSPESLLRLDALLKQIGERAQPGRAELDSPPGQNFAALLAYYVIEIVHRRSRVEIVWHDRVSGLRALPPGMQLPQGPTGRLVAHAPDPGEILLPLAWLEAQLLPDGKRLKAADYIAGLVAQLERDGPAAWWSAAHAAGRIASWQMQAAANGRPVRVSMVSQKSPRTLTVVGTDSVRAEDLQLAVLHGVQLLGTNPDGVTWQVLSHHGYIEDEGVRLDAMIVVAATYGEPGLRMVMAFPYRPVRDASRFEILRPRLREANVPAETVVKLNMALERGMREASWGFGGSWNEFYRG